MKTLIQRFTSLVVVSLSLAAGATSLNAHETIATGPNKGRLLKGVTPAAEFLVTSERKVQITFVGADGKAVAPADQVVTVTTGDRAAPTTLGFTKQGNVLVSDAALPAGNDFPTVVQIKPTADAKATVARFNLNLSICGECERPEYACICGH